MTVISKLHWPVSLCHSYREQTCSVFWHHCTQRFLKGEKASTHHRDNNEQHNHFHWVSFSNFSRRQRGRKYRTDGIYSHTRDVCTGHKKLYFYWETPEMASVAVALVQGSTLSVTTHHPLSQQSTHSSFPAPGSLFIALILEQPVFQCRPVGLLPETFIPLTSHKKVPRSLQEVQMTNFSSADVTSQLNWSLGCWWDETNIAVSGCLWVWGLMWSVVWQKPMRTFHEALITELSVATLSKTGTLKDDIHAIHFFRTCSISKSFSAVQYFSLQSSAQQCVCDHSTVRAEQKFYCIHCLSPSDLQSRAPAGIKTSCLTAGKNKNTSSSLLSEGFPWSDKDLKSKTKYHFCTGSRSGAHSVLINSPLTVLPWPSWGSVS